MTSSLKQLESTLLSTPGTPNAFSTALKPPGSVSHKTNSVLELESHQSPATELDVAGRLSLGSVESEHPLLPSNKTANGLQSPNESELSESLGILDLDAMGDSGMSQFLASPHGELQLRLSVATSARSSVPPTDRVPAVTNQRPALILPSPPIHHKGVGLDVSGSSEEELALSAGDLEQLDVTLSDQSDHSTTVNSPSPQEQSLSMPSSSVPVNGLTTNSPLNPFHNGDDSFEGVQFELCDQGSEFKALDQASFLEQLSRDEEALNEQNLTPSESQLTSFTQTPQETELSVGSYFRGRSDKLGRLSAGLSPHSRPYFSDSSHMIKSPSVNPSTPHSDVISTGSAVLSLSNSLPVDNPLDFMFNSPAFALTLSTPPVEVPNGSFSLSQGLPSFYLDTEHTEGVPSSHDKVSTPPALTPSNSLTLSRDSVRTTPSLRDSVGTTPGLRDSVHVGTTPSLRDSVGATPGLRDSVRATPDLRDSVRTTPGLRDSVRTTPGLRDSVRTTPGLRDSVGATPGLRDSVEGLSSRFIDTEPSSLVKSQPLTPMTTNRPLTPPTQLVSPPDPQPDDSTLVFPELSLLSSAPPSLPYTVATPPSGYLPLGFEVTTISDPPSFDESGAGHVTSEDPSTVGPTPTDIQSPVVEDDCHVTDNDKTLTVDTSHMTSMEDHVIESVSENSSTSDPPPLEQSAVHNHSASVTPTVLSTVTPTSVPSTTTPTNVPSTGTPTDLPSTVTPTDVPFTATPTNVPFTVTPTGVPSTATPTLYPSTTMPIPIVSSTQSVHRSTLFTHSLLFTASPTVSMVTTSSVQAVTCPKLLSTPTHDPSPTLPPLSPSPPTPHSTTHRAPPSPVGGIPTDWLEVCPSLVFPGVCCVGTSVSEWAEVSNRGDRWIQVTLTLSQLHCNGLQCSTDSNVFVLTQRLFIGPGSKERVKVTFSPREAGVYDGVLSVSASLVVSSGEDPAPLTSLTLRASAETPRLTIPNPSTHRLDFGMLVGGATLTLPVELVNSGSAHLPLRVTLSCEESLHRMYFTVEDQLGGLPTSPRSHPHSLTLSLPPHPHNKPHPLHVKFSTPKFYHTEMSRPPLTMKGSLDIVLDSTHTLQTITSLPVEGVVGVAKLLAPGAFQGNDFTLTCVVGRTKTERVPLRNAGNVPLKVLARMSDPTHFLVSPPSFHIHPGQESYVDVTFAPTFDPVTSDVTLMLHVDPNGPDYNLCLRGVAVRPSSPEVVTSRAVVLPDAIIGGHSEGVLEVTNRGHTPLSWTLTPAASPFLKAIDSDQLFKVNYPVFQLPVSFSTLSPEHTTKVTVLFQPQEEGLFSQLWDLEVGRGRGTDQQVRVSFGGTARRHTRSTVSVNHEHTASEEQRARSISKWLTQVTHPTLASRPTLSSHRAHFSQETPSSSHSKVSHQIQSSSHTKGSRHSSSPHRTKGSHRSPSPHRTKGSHRSPSPHRTKGSPHSSPPRRSVYIREEEVVFPPTPLHTCSTVKVQVCNKDIPLVKFTVITPTPPFSVEHHSFKLGSRQCARLPIRFTPTAAGQFHGVVALRTDLKHQAFVVVRGEATDSAS